MDSLPTAATPNKSLQATRGWRSSVPLRGFTLVGPRVPELYTLGHLNPTEIKAGANGFAVPHFLYQCHAGLITALVMYALPHRRYLSIADDSFVVGIGPATWPIWALVLSEI